MNKHIEQSRLLTVSGLLRDSISFSGNTFDVMLLVLLHIAWKLTSNKILQSLGNKKLWFFYRGALKVAYYSFIRVQEVYTTNAQI